MLGNSQEMGMEQLRNLSRDYFKLSSTVMQVRIGLHQKFHDQGSRQMFRFLQNAFPMRMKGAHFVNEAAVIGYIFEMIKFFLSEKTKRQYRYTKE